MKIDLEKIAQELNEGDTGKPTTYDNTIEWLYGEQREDGSYPTANIDFSYYRDFGTMVVTTIIVDTDALDLEDCEEAIRNFFPLAMFERPLTVNYKK